MLVVTAPFVFNITLYQHLKIADQNGIVFLEIKTQTFDDVVFALNKNGLL